MIDEDRTMQLYGYTSDELKPQSSKPVVAVCEECGKYRVLRRQDYRDLCYPCARPLVNHRHTAEELRKMSLAHMGKKAYNWKGGISKWRNYIWKTPAYKNWRAAVFERDDYTCQMCGDHAGGNLQAHHIRPVRDHKNDLVMYDVDNGITLCKDCHKPIAHREYEYIERFEDIIQRGG